MSKTTVSQHEATSPVCFDRRYRIWTKRRGWEVYLPPAGEPVPFVVRHRRELCLVYSSVSDAEFFAKPETPFQFTVREDDRRSGCFTFRATTRQGGHIAGDAHDLRAIVQRYRSGTPLNRLRRALRSIALRDVHRVVADAPDIVIAWRWRPVR